MAQGQKLQLFTLMIVKSRLKFSATKTGIISGLVLAIASCDGTLNNQVLGYNYQSIAINESYLSRYYTYDIDQNNQHEPIFYGYNHSRHSFDVFNLTKKDTLGSYELDKFGPSGINNISSINVKKGLVYIDTSSDFIIYDIAATKIITKVSYRNAMLEDNPFSETYQFGKMMKIALHDQLQADSTGFIKPIYPFSFFSQPNYRQSTLIAKVDYQGNYSPLPIPFPPLMAESNKYWGDLDDIQFIKIKNNIYYSFRNHADIYVYNGEDNLLLYSKPMNLPVSQDLAPSAIGNWELKNQHFFNSVRYHTLKKNHNANLFYRTYKLDTEGNNKFDYSRNYLLEIHHSGDYYSYKLNENVVPNLFENQGKYYAQSKSQRELEFQFVEITKKEN